LDRFVTILSIDGGGIRGIIPAMIVAEIEKRTNAPAADLFQLIAGTSTGGILGLGLSVPNANGRPRYSAAELAESYRLQGEKIFPRRSIVQEFVSEIAGPKYLHAGIESVVRQRFGETHLKDALTDVMVTSYDIEARQPFHFKSWAARIDPAHDYLMWQAARATSAAPTYFSPVRIQSVDSTRSHTLIDGGVYANNPAMCAISEASRLHPPGLVRFVIVSLGTGVLTRPYRFESALRWGQLEWVRPVLDIILQGTDAAVDYQINELLGEFRDPTRYYRLQGVLAEADDDMDNVSPENLRLLEQLAQQIIHENDGRLNELCGFLTQALTSRAPLRDEGVPPIKAQPG
jgi:uncharacterized protein